MASVSASTGNLSPSTPVYGDVMGATNPVLKSLGGVVDDALALANTAAGRWAFDKAAGVLQQDHPLPAGFSAASVFLGPTHFNHRFMGELAARFGYEPDMAAHAQPEPGTQPEGPASLACLPQDGDKSWGTIFSEATYPAGAAGLRTLLTTAIASSKMWKALPAEASTLARLANDVKPVRNALLLGAGATVAAGGLYMLANAGDANSNCPDAEDFGGAPSGPARTVEMDAEDKKEFRRDRAAILVGVAGAWAGAALTDIVITRGKPAPQVMAQAVKRETTASAVGFGLSALAGAISAVYQDSKDEGKLTFNKNHIMGSAAKAAFAGNLVELIRARSLPRV